MLEKHRSVNTTESLVRMLALTATLLFFFATLALAPLLVPIVSERMQSEPSMLLTAQVLWFSYSSLFLIIAFGAFLISPLLIKRRYGLYRQSLDYPKIRRMVETLSFRIDLKHPPRVHVTESKKTSAFIFGRTSRSATLVISEDLVKLLEPSELETIILHELSHVRNRDMSFMTWGVTFVEALEYWFPIWVAIDLVLELQSGMLHLDGMTEFFSQSATKLFVFVILPALAVFSVSRIREFLADARASLYLENNSRLVSALRKSARRLLLLSIMESLSNKKRRFVFKSCPLSKYTLDTHPKLEKRLRALEKAEYIVSPNRVYIPSLETSVYAGIAGFYFLLAGTGPVSILANTLMRERTSLPTLLVAYFALPLIVIVFLNSYGYVRYSDFSFMNEKVSLKHVRDFVGIFLRNAVSSLTLLLAMVLFSGFNSLEFSLVIFVFYLLISFLVSLILPVVKDRIGKATPLQS